MLTAHRAEDIRAAEESLAAGLPDGELMRRAARGLADALDVIPAGEVVLVLVGPGNNGGDALFAAVHLLDRGVRVDLCLLDESKVHAAGLDAARRAGAHVVAEPTTQRWCLDAILGIGARPGLRGTAERWADWVERHRPHTIAVDVPSGVGVDDGTIPGPYVCATSTITFGTHKPALLAGPAADIASRDDDLPTLVDIGLRLHLGVPAVEAIDASDGDILRHHLRRNGPQHKYTRGVVGIAAGSEDYAGAAHLCVAGARAGVAGMIRFSGSDALGARIVDRAPEVVVGPGRVQAWVVGPGGGDDVADQLAAALDDGVPLVVDASALAHLPERFEVPALLTPHAGELAAMLGLDRDTVESDPLRHAAAAAQRWDATVLLKGKRTVVAHTGSPTRVNLSGTTWLGTAGSGDVLAGFAGSLLAAGLEPRDAGSVAAFLHGAAGVRANPGGPVAASDIASALPATVAAFLTGALGRVRDWTL